MKIEAARQFVAERAKAVSDGRISLTCAQDEIGQCITDAADAETENYLYEQSQAAALEGGAA